MRNLACFALVLAGCSSSLNAFSDKTPLVDGLHTGDPTGDDDDDDDDDDDTIPTGDDDDTPTGDDDDTPTGDDDDDTTVPPVNTPPVCVADASLLNPYVLQPITLDGTGSYDPDGDPLTYAWTFQSAPATSGANLIGASTDTAQFAPDKPGQYILELVVDDGTDDDACTVVITADEPNQVPVANAGFNQRVETGDIVLLDGTASSDPNGDPLTYQWQLTRVPAGSGAYLNSATSSMPNFEADLEGEYVVGLVVSDGQLSSSPAEVRITAETRGGGGGGTSDTCFGCAAANLELERRLSVGDAAGSAGLVLLPILLILAQRRRED